MNRDTLLEPIVRSVRKGTAYSRREIERAMADWTLTPILVQGEHVGTLANRGTEVHIALNDCWRPAASYRGVVRDLLQPIFDAHGFITTRLLLSHTKEASFVERAGFKPTWHDGYFRYYLLATLPFEKRKS